MTVLELSHNRARAVPEPCQSRASTVPEPCHNRARAVRYHGQSRAITLAHLAILVKASEFEVAAMSRTWQYLT